MKTSNLNLRRIRSKLLSAIAEAQSLGFQVDPTAGYGPQYPVDKKQAQSWGGVCLLGSVNVANDCIINGFDMTRNTSNGPKLVAKAIGVTVPQLRALESGFCWPNEEGYNHATDRYMGTSADLKRMFALGKRLRDVI